MSLITYEFPTNQQTRKFLRLEQTFKTVRDLMDIKEIPAQKAALFRLMEIIDFFDRNDIKSELIKELERLHQNMLILSENPAVDSSKLNYFISQLIKLSQALSQQGRPSDQLKNDKFLTLVRQKWSLGASLCSFDAPQISYLMSNGPEDTYIKIASWYDTIKIYRTSANVILRLYRESGEFKNYITKNLNYQENIDNKIKIVALKLPQEIEYVPEMSVGAHRMSLQLKPLSNTTTHDIEIQFSLAFYRA